MCPGCWSRRSPGHLRVQDSPLGGGENRTGTQERGARGFTVLAEVPAEPGGQALDDAETTTGFSQVVGGFGVGSVDGGVGVIDSDERPLRVDLQVKPHVLDADRVLYGVS